MRTKLIIALVFFFILAEGTRISLAQLVSPGKLTSSHKVLSGISKCVMCHSIGNGIPDSTCKSCHERLISRIKENKGFHATVTGNCISCHTDHKGEDFNIMPIDNNKFDHALTGFSLEDKHRTLCSSCHKKEKTFLGLTTDCLHCHTDVHQKTLPECLKCHSFKGWKSMQFNHDGFSKFKLTGKHREVRCESCHPEQKLESKSITADKINKVLKFKPLKSDKCSACHNDFHKDLKDKACESCHSTKGWKEQTFDHGDPGLSDFKLQGSHAKVSCELCHPEEKVIIKTNGNEVETRVRKLKPIKHAHCSDCHFDVHKGQFNDRKCDSCHTVQEKWQNITFKHEAVVYKGFKLEGKHKDVACEKCHQKREIPYKEFNKNKTTTAGIFKPLKSDKCTACHNDFHKDLKDKSCESCHSTKGWREQSFDHSNPGLSDFKLEGSHTQVSCELCHPEEKTIVMSSGKQVERQVKKLKPIQHALCNDCHFDVHQEQFKDRKCDSCHTVMEKWSNVTFKHEAKEYKGFKLEGKHINVSCEKCHARSEVKFVEFGSLKQVLAGKFKPIEYAACISCHEDKHDGKFEKACEKCHIPDGWEPRKFLHDPLTSELQGVHNTLSCGECHKQSKNYKGVDSNCISCHKDVHFNQFGRSCGDCHRQQTWIPPFFKHTGVGFSLAGGHRKAECTDCHKNRNYRNTPSDCFICHQTDYQSAPNHVTFAYAHDCTECHQSSGTWQQVSYDHESFAFQGAHASLKGDCSICHVSVGAIRIGTTNSDCYNCHATAGVATTKYEGVTSPSHVTNNFSRACTDCHTNTAWAPANYTHISFQFSGVHSTLTCTACHTNGYPGSYSGVGQDNCYACHTGDYQTAPNHVSVGYPHDCTTCHSITSWIGAEVHQTFQFIYRHGSLACTACHGSGYPGQYAGVSETDCYACHVNDYREEHTTCSHTCTLCHNGNNWSNPRSKNGCN